MKRNYQPIIVKGGLQKYLNNKSKSNFMINKPLRGFNSLQVKWTKFACIHTDTFYPLIL